MVRRRRLSTHPRISETLAMLQMVPLVFGFFWFSSNNRSRGDCGSIDRSSCSRARHSVRRGEGSARGRWLLGETEKPAQEGLHEDVENLEKTGII